MDNPFRQPFDPSEIPNRALALRPRVTAGLLFRGAGFHVGPRPPVIRSEPCSMLTSETDLGNHRNWRRKLDPDGRMKTATMSPYSVRRIEPASEAQLKGKLDAATSLEGCRDGASRG